MYESFYNWAKTVDWQAWAIFANAIAITAAAFWAKETFSIWKNQHHYSRKSQLVEEILIAFEEGADALFEIRNPISFGDEIQKAKELVPESVINKGRFETGIVIMNRVSENQDKWDKIVALFSPCRVHFGDETQNSLRVLLKCVKEVHSAAGFYAREDGSDNFQNRMETKMWRHSDFDEDGNEKDEIGDRINAARKTLYTNFEKYLS